MAIKRFATGTPYGCVEMNTAAFGSSTMKLRKRSKKKPAAVTDTVAVVYSAEKDYGMIGQGGLGYFSQGAGDMPRLGRPVIGDKYTTNTFCYDDTTWATPALLALWRLMLPLRCISSPSTSGVPQLVLAAGIENVTTVAKVIKVYTVPNGHPWYQSRIH